MQLTTINSSFYLSFVVKTMQITTIHISLLLLLLTTMYYCTLAKTEIVYPRNVGAKVAMDFT